MIKGGPYGPLEIRQRLQCVDPQEYIGEADVLGILDADGFDVLECTHEGPVHIIV